MDKVRCLILEWFKRFMEGRTGVDHFSMGLLFFSIILTLIGQLIGWKWIVMLAWLPLVYCYYRILSKDKIKRHQENIVFLRYWYPIQTKIMNRYRQFKVRRQYKYYKCKDCGQQLRVPKGKGKIEITCPKCKTSFIKKT